MSSNDGLFFSCSEDSGRPQSLPEEIQETPKGQTLSWTFGSSLRLQYGGDLNRSTQHLLILLDKEVADGDVTDIVHGEAEG